MEQAKCIEKGIFKHSPKCLGSNHLSKKIEKYQGKNLRTIQRLLGILLCFIKLFTFLFLVMAKSIGTNSTITKYYFDFNNSSDICIYLYICLSSFPQQKGK